MMQGYLLSGHIVPCVVYMVLVLLQHLHIPGELTQLLQMLKDRELAMCSKTSKRRH
jgi:prephenate dehydratase